MVSYRRKRSCDGGLGGRVLVAASPGRPVQPVGPVSPGVSPGCPPNCHQQPTIAATSTRAARRDSGGRQLGPGPADGTRASGTPPRLHLVDQRPRRNELLRAHRRARDRLPGFALKLDTHPPTVSPEQRARTPSSTTDEMAVALSAWDLASIRPARGLTWGSLKP